MHLKQFLEYKLFEVNEYSLTVYSLALIVFVFLFVKALLWFIKKTVLRRARQKKSDPGSELALFQIISYLVWVMAVAAALESIGVKITILLAGSAALLVGIGLGLQQTFNDIISGIILLIEGTTRVGDVLEVDGAVVRVQEIGLRASKVVNRDDIVIIIPNSYLVTNKVINWSHQKKETRFKITVGVAYGSDVDLVIRLLEESAAEHDMSSKKHKPEARFTNFGDSALDFDVIFWSKEMFRIPKVMSDIRRNIDRKFRENKVSIPFPQRDLHIKSSNIPLK